MTPSVAQRAVAAGILVLALALLAVGASTAVVLHLREAAALDRALLAAAHARALAEVPSSSSASRPPVPQTTRPEATGEARLLDRVPGSVHSGRSTPTGAREVTRGPPDLETWVAAPEGDRVPPRIRARAARGEAPLIKDMGDDRLVLLPVRVGGEPAVVAALAQRVTVARSVGPFAAVWVGTSLAALAAAAAGMVRAVRWAFRPLDRAGLEVARVLGLGQGQRVSTEAPAEVVPLLVAVNALLDRLDRAHEVQVRFTAEAAHELRTPVTALLGQLDVALRRDRTAEELRRVVGSAREDVGRLRRLVEALTALARVDSGEVEARRELVRAADLAAGVIELEREELDRAGCRTTLHVDDDPELEVHRVLLELALGNLLRNAARHAPGADVTVTVRAVGERALFEVRDTGPGLPAGFAAVAFDRFARGPETRRADPGGLGLGLALAREVARRHGGDCELRSGPAGGTLAALAVRTPAEGV